MSVFCEITSNYVKASSEDGEVKTISLPDFIAALSSSLLDQRQDERSSTNIEFPLGMFAYEESLNVKKFALYYPQREVEVLFRRMSSSQATLHRIVMPNVIILCKLTRDNREGWSWDRGSRYLKFLMTDLPVNQLPSSVSAPRLYRTGRVAALAMPNMYEGGHMCMGQNALPPSLPNNKFRGLRSAYEMLLNSPFNCDLSVPNASPSNADEWMQYLVRCREEGGYFPYDVVFNRIRRRGSGAFESEYLEGDEPVEDDDNDDDDEDLEDDDDADRLL